MSEEVNNVYGVLNYMEKEFHDRPWNYSLLKMIISIIGETGRFSLDITELV